MITNLQATLEVALICLLVMFYALFVSGCAEMFSSKTSITYTGLDGRQVVYESTKQQEGLDVSFEEVAGKPTAVKIHVDKASTPEEVVKAALQANMGMQDILKALIAAGMAPK